jgi:hypothetical protein
MSFRTLHRRLDHLEQVLPVRQANFWDFLFGYAEFDELDANTQETLRQALADSEKPPVDVIEQRINAALIGSDGCTIQASSTRENHGL